MKGLRYESSRSPDLAVNIKEQYCKNGDTMYPSYYNDVLNKK